MPYLEIIKQEIEKILKDNFGAEGVNFQVGFPETLEHGDVTTNVCLVVSKLAKKSPQEVFEIIRPHLTLSLQGEEEVQKGKEDLDFIEKVEFANPGFVNICFKPGVIQKELNRKFSKSESEDVKTQTQTLSKKFAGKKVLVEHTSVNLFKPFNLGHLMTNFTGEFIFRILKEVGADAISMSYPSDKSIGIAKAIFIIKKDGGLSQEIFQKDLNEVVKYLGEAYVRGVNEYKNFEENGNQESIREIKNIANNIFNEVSSEDLNIFEFSKNKNIEYFKKMIVAMGSNFEELIFESEAGVEGKRIVLENTESVNFISKLFAGKKIFKRSEGAIIYTPSESRKDISTSVFINSEGNPTYLAKDIGLLFLKFKKYNPDLSIYVVDNEQIAHFKSVFDAGGKIEKRWEEKSIHVPHGRMTFKGKKMSSRLGGVPNGEEVINAVLDEVKEKGESGSVDRFTNFSVEEKENLQKEIALSALRVSILRSKPGVNIDFDPERSLSFEGDSGPYLCYTHARCCSLLEKGALALPITKVELEGVLFASLSQGEGQGRGLLRKLFQFDKIVVDAAEEIAPQKLIKYLFEVAAEFNNFYANNKIILDNKTEQEILQTQYNLYLVFLVKKVLEKGLYLIGVKAPSRM